MKHTNDDAALEALPPLESTPTAPAWRAILSGTCASLIGIGLARFAYTPLLPAVVSAGWFGAETAAYLAAANLGGYLIGILLADTLAARGSARTALRIMMAASTLSLFACALPASFLWFFSWRLVSGIGGGVIMILAAPTIMAHLPAARRGLASGFVFMGIGLGIAASGTLVPLLLREGLTQTWIGLGVVGALLTVVAWSGWPSPRPSLAMSTLTRARTPHAPSSGALRVLYGQYALNAVGLVPHMVFLVVFVAHGLGQGVDAGAFYWVAFGLGAVLGPLLSGHLADRAGYRAALRLVLLLEALAALIPAFTSSPGALLISSVVMGAATPGIGPLVLGRVHELAGPRVNAQKAAWKWATAAFAAGQALAAYLMTYLLTASGGNYAALFETAAAALLLALLIDLVSGLAVRPKRASPQQPPP